VFLKKELDSKYLFDGGESCRVSEAFHSMSAFTVSPVYYVDGLTNWIKYPQKSKHTLKTPYCPAPTVYLFCEDFSLLSLSLSSLSPSPFLLPPLFLFLSPSSGSLPLFLLLLSLSLSLSLSLLLTVEAIKLLLPLRNLLQNAYPTVCCCTSQSLCLQTAGTTQDGLYRKKCVKLVKGY
jgi:hypothetical protein